MSHRTLLRWGGFSALFGWLYPVALYLANQALHVPTAIIWLLSPFTIVLLCLAFAGLHASQPVDALGHVGLALACLGGLAYFLGFEGPQVGLFLQSTSVAMPDAWIGNALTWEVHLEFKSYVLIGLGLILLGISLSRVQTARGRLPIFLGALLVLLWMMFDQSLGFNKPIWTSDSSAIFGGVVLVLFALGWFRLGAQLVRAADAPRTRVVASATA